MSRPGKTIVVVLLVLCAIVFAAIVWTAIATDKDSNTSGTDPRAPVVRVEQRAA